MNIRLLVVALCIGSSFGPALAFDWSLNTTLFETLEANDNQALRAPPAGWTLGSYSTIRADATGRTPSSKILLNGDFTYTKYSGPGTSVIPQTEAIAGGLNAHYETSGKDPSDRQYIEAGWRTSSAQLAILSDLGFFLPVNGSINFATVSGGWERNLTSRDFVSLSARSGLTYYDPSSAGVQFLDTTANARWTHRVSTTTSLSIVSNAQWLSYDNAQRSNVVISRNTAGIDLSPTPLLDFHAAGGAAYIQVDQQGLFTTQAPPPATGVLTGTSGSVVGFIGDMSVVYRLFKSTSLTVNASRTIASSVVGTLVQSDTVGASLSHIINHNSSLNVATSFTRQNSGGSSDFYSAAVGYTRELARDWNVNLSYRFLHRSATSGNTSTVDPITLFPIFASASPASSNAFIVTVWHTVSILPPGH